MPTLREIRESKHMTREELAYKAGLSVFTIARLETGKHTPRNKTVRVLARILKVKPEDIVFPAPEKPEQPERQDNGGFLRRLLR